MIFIERGGKRLISALWVLTLFSTSFAAGLIGAILGIGGGAIIVPVLSSLLGMPIKEAIAASLVCVVATSVASSRKYLPQGLVNPRLALFLEMGTVIGAVIGAFSAFMVSPVALHIALGVILIILAAIQIRGARREDDMIRLMAFSRTSEDSLAKIFKLSSKYYDSHFKVDVEYRVTNSGLGLASSLLAGLMSGALGLGGGIFKVPIMNRLMKVPIKVSIATSELMIGMTGSIGAITYLSLGLLNLEMVAPMVIGIALGSTIGAIVMSRMRASRIRIAFSLLLVYLSYMALGKGLSLAFNMTLPGV
ncbi:MAG: sulfite exporter TauE/SafE family protein [Candidatus Nezhaarchaeales archaeon]